MRRSFWLLVLGSVAQAQTTNESLKLAPPYAELPPTYWEQYGSLTLIASVLVVAAIVAIGWLASRPKPVPPVPPELEARRAFARLHNQPEDGALLSEICQILRRYFVAAFELPADQMTTNEFCAALSRSTAVGNQLSSALADFLQTCDVRKFAPATSAPPLNAVARAQELFERGELRRGQLAAPAEKTTA